MEFLFECSTRHLTRSLRLLVSYRVEHEKRNSISTSNMYYFDYRVNTIVFYWKEKSTLLKNENKRINDPRIKIVMCIGAKARDEKMP